MDFKKLVRVADSESLMSRVWIPFKKELVKMTGADWKLNEYGSNGIKASLEKGQDGVEVPTNKLKELAAKYGMRYDGQEGEYFIFFETVPAVNERVNDAVELEEGVNIVYGAPGGGFPSFEQVEHIVDKEIYEALSKEYYEKFHKEACEYYSEENDDIDFMYSEAVSESCGFLSTVNPESEMLVEWDFTKETDDGTIYAGLIGL